jgi:hypothetical protein
VRRGGVHLALRSVALPGPKLWPIIRAVSSAGWRARAPCPALAQALGDGPAVVELFRGVGADDDSLQLAGDGLVAAVMRRVDGAAELARDLVVGLRQRGWDGDDELADQLEARLGSGPVAMLRALPVDLEELAGILEGDPLSVGGRIDIRTGEVWPQAAIEYPPGDPRGRRGHRR